MAQSARTTACFKLIDGLLRAGWLRAMVLTCRCPHQQPTAAAITSILSIKWL